VSSRLARARGRLRARLTRRGVALSTGTLAAALASQTSAAVVPVRLAQTAAQTGFSYSAGLQVVGRVAELANGFLKSQALARCVKVAGLLATAGLIAVVILFFTLGRKARPDAPMSQGAVAKSDSEAIQGTWNATKVRHGGQEMIPAENVQMVFAGDRVTSHFPGLAPLSGTFRLDPSKDPKEIDLIFPAGVTWRGMYGLEGDQLQLCIDLQARERPVSLTDERFFSSEMKRETVEQR